MLFSLAANEKVLLKVLNSLLALAGPAVNNDFKVQVNKCRAEFHQAQMKYSSNTFASGSVFYAESPICDCYLVFSNNSTSSQDLSYQAHSNS